MWFSPKKQDGVQHLEKGANEDAWEQFKSLYNVGDVINYLGVDLTIVKVTEGRWVDQNQYIRRWSDGYVFTQYFDANKELTHISFSSDSLKFLQTL